MMASLQKCMHNADGQVRLRLHPPGPAGQTLPLRLAQLPRAPARSQLDPAHSFPPPPRTSQKLDTAVEVLGTLRELLANAEPTKFLLYPQIILVAMSLLNSSVVRIGELAMAILLQVRRVCVELERATCTSVGASRAPRLPTSPLPLPPPHARRRYRTSTWGMPWSATWSLPWWSR